MQVRRIALVVCLLAMVSGATGTVSHRTQRVGKADDGIIATILDLLGLDNKVGVPPG
jgi:hypothetical protein